MDVFQQALYWLIAGSKGGTNRARILFALEKEPTNSNALTKKLKLDYKTTQHHILLLSENHLIVRTGGKYGQVFFISPQLKENWSLFKKLFEEKILKEEEK
jgi:DNA-binding MarR family transcriptional regulator